MITITCFLEACIETPLFRTTERVTLTLRNKHLDTSKLVLCTEPYRLGTNANWIIGYSAVRASYLRARKKLANSYSFDEFMQRLAGDGEAVILATHIEFVEDTEYKKLLLQMMFKQHASLRSEIASLTQELMESVKAYTEIVNEIAKES
jgi:hypothetical protein